MFVGVSLARGHHLPWFEVLGAAGFVVVARLDRAAVDRWLAHELRPACLEPTHGAPRVKPVNADVVQVHNCGHRGERDTEEVRVDPAEEHVLSAPLEHLDEAHERHRVIKEVDLVDADDVVRRINERPKVIETLEERARATFAVAALVTIVIITLACEWTEDGSSLMSVLLAAIEVADERIALSGGHRAGVQGCSAEGTEWTKNHGFPPRSRGYFI